jgi:ATP-binding cassette subfamily F protein 3
VLTLENIGIEFGGRWLIRGATYQFSPGERIGLIGRNGAGKSTLLKVITGDISPSEGKVHRINRLKIGYLHQDLLSFSTERSIFEVAQDAYAPLLAVKRELDQVLEAVEAGSTDAELWDRMAHLQEEWDAGGGESMAAEVHTVLAGLGFSDEQRLQPFQTFSGGWRMRVLLAKMLLEQPDILLLDEPTNHLDLPSIQWLENYLRNFRGACIIVSHDRFFLDRMADKILEVSLQQLFVYAGNYSYYIEEKAMRMELHTRAYENQQKFIEEQERFINRFRAKASKAKQAQSRVKQLDRLERIAAPEEESFDLRMRFRVRQQSGREVLALHRLRKAYGGRLVLDGGEGTVMRGDKIGLIGANGIGKSTILRILAGGEPFEGERKLGHNVQLSFYAQHQLEALTLKHNILEEVEAMGVDKTEAELRTVLGCFMFSGEDIFKKVSVLSGGEKARVALAKTLLSEANLLLLDEPTNHLDIPSIQLLVEAIREYEGTCVIVSHDRFFLQQATNKIWYIEDRKLNEYPGSYDEYSEWHERQLAAAAPAPKKEPARKPEPEKRSDVRPPQDKQDRNRLRKLEKDQELTEAHIARLEVQVAEALDRMAAPEVAGDYARMAALQREHADLQGQLEAAMRDWEAIAAEYEDLSARAGA